MRKKYPLPQRTFPPDRPTPTQARTQEKNKGRSENRVIHTAPITPEDTGFPFAERGARLLRQTQDRSVEEVVLITSAPAERLDASRWLLLNRQGWGIESGLHQRLDVSYNDDRCRVQSDNGIWVLGMFRRIANSCFMEWKKSRPRLHHVTTTDFQTLMAEDYRDAALRFVLAKRPSIKSLSRIGPA